MVETRAADRAHGPCRDLPPLPSTVSAEVEGGVGWKARAARRLRGAKTARTMEATHFTSSMKVGRVPELFSLEEDPGGGRPAPLPEVAGRQVCLERHVMEDLGSVCPFVQILDLPVPQTVDYAEDALRILDRPMAEQVIEVRKISCSLCPSRSLIPEQQSAEQLVEVPTVLSPLRIAEQIVGIPVPRGHSQGSLPEQSTPATHSSGKRISERIVEQIVDFPEQGVEQIVDISLGDGLGLGSTSSACAADKEFPDPALDSRPALLFCVCHRVQQRHWFCWCRRTSRCVPFFLLTCTAHCLVLSGTCYASVYGVVEFHVFLREYVDYGS